MFRETNKIVDNIDSDELILTLSYEKKREIFVGMNLAFERIFESGYFIEIVNR